jgi:hypothetical protein
MEGQINYLVTVSTTDSVLFADLAVVSVDLAVVSALTTVESVVGLVDFAPPPQAARVAIATIAITFFIIIFLFIIEYTI